MPRTTLAAALAVLALAAPAGAAVPHTVAAGETLWTIAAANNFTTHSIAVYNGLSDDSAVVLGSTIMIPSVAEAAAKLASAGVAAPASTSTSSAAPAAPEPMGAYTVRPGDTLSGLAASSGVSASAIAAMNGLTPTSWLIAGTALKLPTGAPLASQPSPPPTTAPAAAPSATPGRVTAEQINEVATRNGVPGSLAAAIAWQESGFNNAMVSAANARGVMQVMPGTWDWVQQNLAKRYLDPASPIDNVGAGVLYLGQMLRDSGGDPRLAAAGYYQGMGSVRSIGLLPETQRYVDNVLALQSRFGG